MQLPPTNNALPGSRFQKRGTKTSPSEIERRTLTWAYGQIGAYAARSSRARSPQTCRFTCRPRSSWRSTLTTARSLGLKVPPNLFVLAQKIVE
jgi:hypothetical protein